MKSGCGGRISTPSGGRTLQRTRLPWIRASAFVEGRDTSPGVLWPQADMGGVVGAVVRLAKAQLSEARKAGRPRIG